jgi:hypothetical protein
VPFNAGFLGRIEFSPLDLQDFLSVDVESHSRAIPTLITADLTVLAMLEQQSFEKGLFSLPVELHIAIYELAFYHHENNGQIAPATLRPGTTIKYSTWVMDGPRMDYALTYSKDTDSPEKLAYYGTADRHRTQEGQSSRYRSRVEHVCSLHCLRQPPLTMVCRQLRQESLKYFYRVNAFCLLSDDFDGRKYWTGYTYCAEVATLRRRLFEWLNVIDERYFREMQKFVLQTRKFDDGHFRWRGMMFGRKPAGTKISKRQYDPVPHRVKEPTGLYKHYRVIFRLAHWRLPFLQILDETTAAIERDGLSRKSMEDILDRHGVMTAGWVEESNEEPNPD